VRKKTYLMAFCFVVLSALPVWAQTKELDRAWVMGSDVRLLSNGNQLSEGSAVTITINGKPAKTFKADLSGAAMIASFNGVDGSYLVWRSDMGQGACAGGHAYVMKFSRPSEQGDLKVAVSAPVADCLGEFPPVNFYYTGPQAALTIDVSGNIIMPDLSLTRWSKTRARGAKAK
jgi:hypothetical protein